VLNNIHLQNVPTAVGILGGQVVLAGGTTTIESWGQGNIYSGSSSSYKFVKSNIPAPPKAASLLDASGRIFGRSHPQYEDYAVDQFISVKSQGAKGDGHTDDTGALQAVLDKVCESTYMPAEYVGLSAAGPVLWMQDYILRCWVSETQTWAAGKMTLCMIFSVYFITNTLKIPAGTQMVGEAWSVIMGGGSAFSNMNEPTVMIQAGAPGSSGILEITDVVFTTQGPGVRCAQYGPDRWLTTGASSRRRCH
jgi:glucan 1,3-beta-glucosidase